LNLLTVDLILDFFLFLILGASARSARNMASHPPPVLAYFQA